MDVKAIVKADPSALFMQKISERLYPPDRYTMNRTSHRVQGERFLALLR